MTGLRKEEEIGTPYDNMPCCGLVLITEGRVLGITILAFEMKSCGRMIVDGGMVNDVLEWGGESPIVFGIPSSRFRPNEMMDLPLRLKAWNETEKIFPDEHKSRGKSSRMSPWKRKSHKQEFQNFRLRLLRKDWMIDGVQKPFLIISISGS